MFGHGDLFLYTDTSRVNVIHELSLNLMAVNIINIELNNYTSDIWKSIR